MIIRIKQLKKDIIIGVNEWERTRKQPICISIDMEYDGRQAAEHDNFVEAVDYDHVHQQISTFLEHSRFYLIETLADRIADLVLVNNRIDEVRVVVEKPMALQGCESVSVEVTKRNSSSI